MVLLRGLFRPVVAHTHSPPSRRNSYETLSSAVLLFCCCLRMCQAHRQLQQHGGCGVDEQRRRIFYSKLHLRPSCSRLYPLPDVHCHLDFTIGLRPTMRCVVARRPAGVDYNETGTGLSRCCAVIALAPGSIFLCLFMIFFSA